MSSYRELTIKEVENGYIVQHQSELIPTKTLTRICANYKELREYVENYFEGGVSS